MKGIIAIVVLLALFFGWTEFWQPRMRIHRAQQAAANELIDPSSAQFRSVRSDGVGGVCGEINGKNRFGAYVGFRTFYADGNGSNAAIEPDPPSDSGGDYAPVVRSSYYAIYHARCG